MNLHNGATPLSSSMLRDSQLTELKLVVTDQQQKVATETPEFSKKQAINFSDRNGSGPAINIK